MDSTLTKIDELMRKYPLQFSNLTEIESLSKNYNNDPICFSFYFLTTILTKVQNPELYKISLAYAENGSIVIF